MKAVVRARRLLSLCALPIALWSAAPSIRWCSVTWADFPECLLRAPAGRCDPAQPASAAPCEGNGAAAGCGGEVCAWGLLCDPAGCAAAGGSCDSPESSESTRGFCIRGPVGGVGVKTEPADDAHPLPLHPLPVTALGVDVETTRPERARTDEWPRPPTAPRAIRPPVRAPPLA